MSQEEDEFELLDPEELSAAIALAAGIRSGSQRLLESEDGPGDEEPSQFDLEAHFGREPSQFVMDAVPTHEKMRETAHGLFDASGHKKSTAGIRLGSQRLLESADGPGDEEPSQFDLEARFGREPSQFVTDAVPTHEKMRETGHGLFDASGYKISTADEFNAAQGTLASQVIRSSYQPLKRGIVANKLDSSPVFEVRFDLTLKSIPHIEANVLHFAAGDCRHSMMPMISVVPGSSMLVVRILHESAEAKMRTSPVPLNQKTKVCFRLIGRLATVLVNGEEEDAMVLEELNLQGIGKFYAYLSSPIDRAADASVGEVVYRWKRVFAQPRVQATTIFEIPPIEVEVMASVQKELARARVWRTFDTVFGCIIFLNAIAMGIQTDCQCDDLVVWPLLEYTFLVVFTFEIVGRLCIASQVGGKSECKKMILYDHWFQFDIFVVGATILQAVVHGEGDSGGPVGLMRQVRLIKIVKSFRLIRAFRQQAILLEGLLQSIGALFWVVILLALTLFIFGILVTELAHMNTLPSHEELQFLGNFRSLTETMWLLLKMSTLDNWAHLVRQGAVEIGTVHSAALSVAIMLCTFLCGFVCLLIIVGLVCGIAFKLDRKMACMAGAEMLERKQRALADLHQYISHAGTHLLEAHQYMEAENMKIFFERDPYVIDLCNVLEVTPSECFMLLSNFSENGMVDINGLIEALGIVVMQDYNNRQTSIDFKRPRGATALRPRDHAFFQLSLRRVEGVFRKTENNCRCICTLACDTLGILYGRMAESSCLLPHGRHDTAYIPPHIGIAESTRTLDVRLMHEVASRFNLKHAQEELLMPTDVVFGTLIVFNAIFMFFQTLGESAVLDGIDFALTILFTIEITLKTIMGANFAYIHQTEATDTDTNFFEQAERKVLRFEQLKAGVRHRIIPPWPATGYGGICREFCRMFMSDLSSAFDVSIVLLCLMDNILMEVVRRGGSANVDTGMFAALRAFRLLRLAKLMRIFKLFPELARLMNTMLETGLQILYALGLVCFVLFVFAICVTTFMYRQTDSVIFSHFGTLYDSFMTGWQVVTFDNWDAVFLELIARNFILTSIALILLVCTMALGMMKLLTGLMCQSALKLNLQDEVQDQKEDLIRFLHAMTRLQSLVQNELQGDLLASSSIDKAMSTRIQPPDQHSQKFLEPRAMEHGESAEFSDKLKNIFAEGGLPDSLIKRVLDKVDHNRCGLVSVEDLTKGALVMKEDLAKVELLCCNTVLRDMHELSTRLNRLILDTWEALQEALTMANAVIARLVVDRRAPREDGHELGSLRPDAEEALYNLSSWEGASATSAAELLGGVLVTTSGTGRIQAVGEEVSGQDTSFLTEVRPGDYIIIEIKDRTEPPRLHCYQVRFVHTPTSLKMHTGLVEHCNDEWHVYFICRLQTPEAKQWQAEGFVHIPVHTKAPEPLSPRCSQQLFEWHIGTRTDEHRHHQQAEQRNHCLAQERMRLELQVLSALSRPGLQKFFRGWKKLVRPKSTMVQYIW